MIVYIIMNTTGNEQRAIRVSRVLRPMFIANFAENRQVCSCNNIIVTLNLKYYL